MAVATVGALHQGSPAQPPVLARLGGRVSPVLGHCPPGPPAGCTGAPGEPQGEALGQAHAPSGWGEHGQQPSPQCSRQGDRDPGSVPKVEGQEPFGPQLCHVWPRHAAATLPSRRPAGTQPRSVAHVGRSL
eukprot:11228331-Lingulodinium_polyedra.AAC.2